MRGQSAPSGGIDAWLLTKRRRVCHLHPSHDFFDQLDFQGLVSGLPRLDCRRRNVHIVVLDFGLRIEFNNRRRLNWGRTPSGPAWEAAPPWGRMDKLHNVENFFAFRADNRRAIEVEERCGASEASALFAPFRFGHTSILSPSIRPRKAGDIAYCLRRTIIRLTPASQDAQGRTASGLQISPTHAGWLQG